jgi:hypothetical protein
MGDTHVTNAQTAYVQRAAFPVFMYHGSRIIIVQVNKAEIPYILPGTAVQQYTFLDDNNITIHLTEPASKYYYILTVNKHECISYFIRLIKNMLKNGITGNIVKILIRDILYLTVDIIRTNPDRPWFQDEHGDKVVLGAVSGPFMGDFGIITDLYQEHHTDILLSIDEGYGFGTHVQELPKNLNASLLKSLEDGYSVEGYDYSYIGNIFTKLLKFIDNDIAARKRADRWRPKTTDDREITAFQRYRNRSREGPPRGSRGGTKRKSQYKKRKTIKKRSKRRY